MTREESRLHITFPAAWRLEGALRTMGVEESVAVLRDNYSMGPINPGDAVQRAEWEREELEDDHPLAASCEVAAFWQNVSAWTGRLVVWMNSRSVVELCGLHVLLWRLPSARLDIVDVANIEFCPENARAYDERWALAFVTDARITEKSLINIAKPVSDIQRASLRRTWRQLRAENAPLRVLTSSGLASAEITHFDDLIRAEITHDWRRFARVIGPVLGPVSEAFCFTRLLELLDEDAGIEWKNELGHDAPWSLRTCWVRRRT